MDLGAAQREFWTRESKAVGGRRAMAGTGHLLSTHWNDWAWTFAGHTLNAILAFPGQVVDTGESLHILQTITDTSLTVPGHCRVLSGQYYLLMPSRYVYNWQQILAPITSPVHKLNRNGDTENGHYLVLILVNHTVKAKSHISMIFWAYFWNSHWFIN